MADYDIFSCSILKQNLDNFCIYFRCIKEEYANSVLRKLENLDLPGDSYNENENITFTDNLCIRHLVNVKIFCLLIRNILNNFYCYNKNSSLDFT